MGTSSPRVGEELRSKAKDKRRAQKVNILVTISFPLPSFLKVRF
jgi:hypothetical protein